MEITLRIRFWRPFVFCTLLIFGLDPNGLKDHICRLLGTKCKHTLINREYCKEPKRICRVRVENWGLTASDNHQGYSAHSPTNDLGVITPTAALSSFPYTPEFSMKALRIFYYNFDG